MTRPLNDPDSVTTEPGLQERLAACLSSGAKVIFVSRSAGSGSKADRVNAAQDAQRAVDSVFKQGGLEFGITLPTDAVIKSLLRGQPESGSAAGRTCLAHAWVSSDLRHVLVMGIGSGINPSTESPSAWIAFLTNAIVAHQPEVIVTSSLDRISRDRGDFECLVEVLKAQESKGRPVLLVSDGQVFDPRKQWGPSEAGRLR